ncbi:MAG: dockerin type I domain-containing protein, partial [Planctomycetota bacterium]|nr:dockerin type I domain-containing protein [Planctomycetota bacterium]
MQRPSQRSRRHAHQSRYSVRQQKHRRVLLLESLEPRTVLSAGLSGALTDCSPWQNPIGSSDVNADGIVSPVDVLMAINALNSGVSGQLAGRLAPPALAGHVQGAGSDFFDANGDEQLTPGDVLQVINSLNLGQDGVPTAAWPSTDQQPDQIDPNVPQLNLVRGFARAYAEINSVGDVDVFSVVPTRDRLNLTLFPLSHVAMNFSIVDVNGNKLDTQTASGSRLGPASVIDLVVTSGDTYYIEVSGGSDVTGRYSLQVMNYGGDDYTPIAPAQLKVSLPTTVQSGQPVMVQLVALNAENHLVDSYSGTANLTSSDATATLPASVTFEHGRASIQVTFATEGSQTLTVTDANDATLTGQATTNVLAPAVATQLAVLLPENVPSGVAVTVQLVALDAQRHLVSNYSGAVSVASSDATVTLPASVTFEQGRASFVVTFATAGSQTLT